LPKQNTSHGSQLQKLTCLAFLVGHLGNLLCYFGACRYNAWDLTRLDVSTGTSVSLDVPLGDLAVHFRGGAVIPMQPYASVTRDIRYAPVTLIVTLPAKPSSGSQAAATAQGPLPPHVLDEPCAAALARDAGQLVSCGLLYSDGDTLQVSEDNTMQVCWRCLHISKA
jgi:hypothetical protein